MSSIYDDPPEPKPTREPQPFAMAEPVQTAEAYMPPPGHLEPTPPVVVKKSGCGCLSCLLGCLGVSVVLIILGGIGMWVLAKKLPDLARQGVTKAVNESDLDPDDKRMVLQQVDRLVDGYKQGKVDFEKLGTLVEDFSQSPLMDLLIAFGAKVKYIEKSGLTPEEKSAAEETLQRVARGAIEKKISRAQLEGALDHISTKLPNGGRQFKEEVGDDELRAFLAEAKRLADEAMVSNEKFKVDVGAELKKLVDKALGEIPAEQMPAEQPAVEKLPAEKLPAQILPDEKR